MRGETYQIVLIVSIVLVTALFGAFFYREIFPEYREYQKSYESIEEFRSTLTGVTPAPFRQGVKQLVLTQDDEGPETIDRCTSCHVALKLSHFSETRVARDINGNVLLDDEGFPQQEANPDYIFKLIEESIAAHPEKADELRKLLSIQVNGEDVDLKKVLVAHPLIGRELRPFEFHPPEEYGCTSCHGGNGRALTSQKAHGPYLDGKYPVGHEPEAPQFLEPDPLNDPLFSKVFNHKPGHKLLFQTTPILVGDLIESKCVQCHRSSSSEMKQAVNTFNHLVNEGQRFANQVEKAFSQEKEALASLLELRQQLTEQGYKETVKDLESLSSDLTQTQKTREKAKGQIDFLKSSATGTSTEKAQTLAAIKLIQSRIETMVGNSELVEKLYAESDSANWMERIEAFVEQTSKNSDANGTLFMKAASAEAQQELITGANLQSRSLERALKGDNALKAIVSDVDLMTSHFQRGQNLYLSQACYACHRIAGFARGGVGPELTYEGNVYPWYIKESMVWPQADLPTSTMPNFHLDHDELQDLMTFLLAQKGGTRSISEIDYDVSLKQWEEGKRLPFEEPVPPAKQHDLDYALTVFATEGCAACHRLKGYSTNVGFSSEKDEDLSFIERQDDQNWFKTLFPELVAGKDIPGSMIVQIIDEHKDEIDRRILADARDDGLLEKIEQEHPQTVESYFSNFKYALRAKDHLEQTPEELQGWKERVRRVMMLFAREYGLGRLVGPRPNWSGIYRDDEWLISHFYNPQAHVAKSIMPVFAFDKTKFFALTYMLDMIAKKNREELQKVWDLDGYSPEISYNLHCAQCHGTMQQKAAAPVAEWVYPIPKNLRSPDYLRSLGRSRVLNSILHGVAGGPMPPWGELGKGKPFDNIHPVITENQAEQLVDWLFQQLPAEGVFGDEERSLKWNYDPEDVIEELELEQDQLLKSKKPDLSMVQREQVLTAGFFPSLGAQETEVKTSSPLTVSTIFDIKDHPVEQTEEKAYYIKQKFYTQENLDEGKRLFIEHCAICHGAEGAGNGLRAATMVEAKPRMLSNLQWIRTRDDLRLLRSIKYGVTGTSMQAWGDTTSPLQRLQLVMYIRKLTKETDMRNMLTTVLYETFDVMEQEVLKQRIAIAGKVEEAQQAYYSARKTALRLEAEGGVEESEINAAVEAFHKEREELQKYEVWRQLDKTVSELVVQVREESQIYDRLGNSFLARVDDRELIDQFLALVATQQGRFTFADGKLELNEDESKQKKTLELATQLADVFKSEIAKLSAEEEQIKGMLPSVEKHERLEDVSQMKRSYSQLLEQMITDLHEAARIKSQQIETYEKLQKEMENR